MAEFDKDLARRQLEANGAMERPCAACGKTNWRVAESMSGLFAATDDVVDLTDTMAARVVPVVCMDCGFVRLHDWQVLSD